LTGLAAFGDPTKYYTKFCELYKGFADIKHSSVDSPIIDFDIFLEMKKRTYALVNSFLEGLTPEEKFEESKYIAAGLQEFAEIMALDYISRVMAENCMKNVNIHLSGGLFANVKINQRVHEEIPEVKNLFVAPPMGDEGTCIGAACGYNMPDLSDHTMTNMTMRMGTHHNELTVDEDLIADRIEGVENVAEDIAWDLSHDKIVCIFDGRMEFGPRALIGRTIMYNCRDVGANDWLNKQLGRTEFMPFAPFCKEESMGDLFYDTEGKEFALKNMTVTVDCKDEFIQNYPAACHVDNTARPQVISQDENELAWKILDEYEKRTGEKALINTSFNLHNYPIIESPEVAIASWKKSNTHVLYIGANGIWYRITRK
jgi:carbamoyltransferase